MIFLVLKKKAGATNQRVTHKSNLHSINRGPKVMLPQVDSQGVLVNEALRRLPGDAVSCRDDVTVANQGTSADVLIVHGLKFISHQLVNMTIMFFFRLGKGLRSKMLEGKKEGTIFSLLGCSFWLTKEPLVKRNPTSSVSLLRNTSTLEWSWFRPFSFCERFVVMKTSFERHNEARSRSMNQ